MVTYKSYDEEIKKNLKEKKQGIGVQSPQSYRDARKAFSQWVKKLEINLKKNKNNEEYRREYATMKNKYNKQNIFKRIRYQREKEHQ